MAYCFPNLRSSDLAGARIGSARAPGSCASRRARRCPAWNCCPARRWSNTGALARSRSGPSVLAVGAEPAFRKTRLGRGDQFGGAAVERRSDLEHQCQRRQVLAARSEEHTSELQSLMRISYAVFCLKKKNKKT